MFDFLPRSLAVAVLLMLGSSTLLQAAIPESVHVMTDSEPTGPVRHALLALKQAIEGKGIRFEQGMSPAEKAGLQLLVGIPGQSPSMNRSLTQNLISVPERAESYLVARCGEGEEKRVLVAGRDPRGTAYALYEIAESIRTSSGNQSIEELIRDQRDSPSLAVRSVTIQLYHEDGERDWYESEEYWHWYFGMLARNRFNNFSLTFGHNTNYMIPPAAYMLEVPGFESVQVTGMSAEDRKNRLDHFRRITEIAEEHGIDFTLGLWTQLPVVAVREGLDFGPSPVVNLPDGARRQEYCGQGLKTLLQECPAIDGIQLRMNLESGIPHDQQAAFYQKVFEGIAGCGRAVNVDLRYKSLNQETINLARSAGLNVTVSTKFWCEHMGLPYHPTWQDPAYSESRYGFGRMLNHERNYRVTYRLWNVGSSRLLLWGDPDYAARFANSCLLGGGEGFEVFAPLNYRGYGNPPGSWRLFADASKEHFRWEQERYWPFYLAFGRFGYDPGSSREIWTREFRHRFGTAGQDLEASLRTLSQIIPLVTTTTQFSANSWRFWPEMMTCMPLDAYRAIPPSDYSQFYAIAPYSSRQQWRSEDWAAKHSAFVEDSINGKLNSKWTPIQVANDLTDFANKADEAVQKAEDQLKGNPPSALEAAAVLVDLKVLSLLARYHAEKKLAATHLEFFRLTKDKARLKFVWKHILKAQEHWQQIAEVTDLHYYDQMVLGHSPEYHNDYAAKLHIHSGHWKDRLGEVQADVDFVKKLMDQNGIAEGPPSDEEVQALKRYPGESGESIAISFQHDRIAAIAPGKDVTVAVKVKCDRPLKQVSVYYRPLNQTVPWKRLTMSDSTGNGVYRVQIGAGEIDPKYDFQYYIEAQHAEGGSFWPHWKNETPYVVVPTSPR